MMKGMMIAWSAKQSAFCWGGAQSSIRSAARSAARSTLSWLGLARSTPVRPGLRQAGSGWLELARAGPGWPRPDRAWQGMRPRPLPRTARRHYYAQVRMARRLQLLGIREIVTINIFNLSPL